MTGARDGALVAAGVLLLDRLVDKPLGQLGRLAAG